MEGQYDHRKSLGLSEQTYSLDPAFILDIMERDCSADFTGITNRLELCSTVQEVKKAYDEIFNLVTFQADPDETDVSRFYRRGLIQRLDNETEIAIWEIEKNHRGTLELTERCSIAPSIRRDVLSAGKCAHCGSTEELHIDHIVALARGGTNHRSNLQCLCSKCNQRKGVKSEAEIIASLLLQVSGQTD